MGNICYRIVAENFAEEKGQTWPVEVLIQTEDPADFDDFEEALEEVLDRIQMRIDREEDRDEPDLGYLDRLREKLGDSNSGDWEEYCDNISQPQVARKFRGRYEWINLAEVAGRERMRRLLVRGVKFENYALPVFNRLGRQAAVGKKVVKVKRKKLKPRVRPGLVFNCVRLDPEIAGRFGEGMIGQFLALHKERFEAHAWSPRKDGFTSVIGRHDAPGEFIHCLTVFLDGEHSVTFATLIGPGDMPEDSDVIDRATVEFDHHASVSGQDLAWRPGFN